MDEIMKKMEELKEFVKTYGEDYLNDGTKESLIKKIDDGDKKIVLKILNTIDKNWIEETKRVGKFRIFTDFSYTDHKGKKITGEKWSSNYTDSLNPYESHIPTLRLYKPRELTVFLSKELTRTEKEK